MNNVGFLGYWCLRRVLFKRANGGAPKRPRSWAYRKADHRSKKYFSSPIYRPFVHFSLFVRRIRHSHLLSWD